MARAARVGAGPTQACSEARRGLIPDPLQVSLCAVVLKNNPGPFKSAWEWWPPSADQLNALIAGSKNAGFNSGGNTLIPYQDASGVTLTGTGDKKTLYGSVFYHFDRRTEAYLAADWMKLKDGYQALPYVRTRSLPCDAIPDFSRIGRQQQFLRAVINQMLRPAELAKAPALVQPVLANLHRDRGFLPGDLVYLVGQLRGLTTGNVEFRTVPGGAGMEGTQSVVLMDPAARQIFAAIRDGKQLGSLGTQLVNTPPSEANTTVEVIDRGAGAAANDVETLLANSGFDVSPGIVDGPAPAGVAGISPRYRESCAAARNAKDDAAYAGPSLRSGGCARE